MSLYVPITFSQIQPLIDSGVSEFQILDVLRRVAIKYTPIIQRSTPVDTGRLKRSIRVELLLDNRGLAVTSEVFYAGFVEYGTKKMGARLFVQQHIPSIISEVLSGLQNLTEVKLGVGQVKQFRNDEQLYSGLTTQNLSQQLLGRVVNNLVRPNSVGRLSIENVQVESERVIELSVANQTIQT